MAQPYIGEIRVVTFSFAPVNWAFCDGSLQSISQNITLYQLIGTTYGGDGTNTFALPNLRSRTPIHAGTLNGNNYTVGQAAGEENVTVTTSQLPQHTHILSASTNTGTVNSPKGNIWASSSQLPYADKTPTVAMSPAAVGNAGNSLPHDNLSPYLAINFIIALNGIYPSQG